MKKLLIAVSLLTCLYLSSCEGNTDTNVTPSGTTGNPNIVTITDNGTTYTETSAQYAGVTCQIDKLPTNSSFTLVTTATSSNGFVISFDIDGIESTSATGIGLFAGKDENTDPDISTIGNVTETFTGGQAYEIDSASINITIASGSNVQGTYELWVSNSSSSKTVTGTINCQQATID